MRKKEENLLNILAEERIHTVLQEALNNNELYQSAEKELDVTLDELQRAGLSREQSKVVDKAISATNASGVAYGATAYRQGLYDGIKLMSAVNQISKVDSILDKQDYNCEKAI